MPFSGDVPFDVLGYEGKAIFVDPQAATQLSEPSGVYNYGLSGDYVDVYVLTGDACPDEYENGTCDPSYGNEFGSTCNLPTCVNYECPGDQVCVADANQDRILPSGTCQSPSSI